MKKRNVGRPRGGDPAETRRGILKAAEESFAAAGFVGATTRQVAARAGVNVATLHYHFGNKERLYRAVLEAAVSGEVPETTGARSPAERLTGVVEALWNFGWTRPSLPRLSLLHRLAGPASAESGAHGPLDDPRTKLLSKTIAEVSAKGALAPDDAARFVLVLMDGALVASRNGHSADAPAPDEPRRAVVAAALRVAGLS
ncbi:MAG TPA: TetR/AcrR family transcriptional regulator [Thermoanaerobaculia bacterium]|jgi:AcrR family transcriptional regulator